MKQLVKIYQKYNNFFHINWFITNKCNFSCEYCHPFNYANTSPKFDINVYKNFIHRILNQIGNKQLIISFTGGEPTSLDWFDEFLDFLIENNVKIGLTSNGSKSIKWWERYRKAFDWVSLSFHAEKSNISHFINIIDTIWSHSLVSVRVMMHPKDEYFKKGITLYKTLKTKPFITVFSVEKVIIIDDWLTDDEKYHVYTSEQKRELHDDDFFYKRQTGTPEKSLYEYKMPIDVSGIYQTDDGRFNEQIELNTNLLASSNENRFYKWKCFGGIEHLHINDRGEIWPTACLQGNMIGNIKNDFTLPKDPLVCEKAFCYCATDIIIAKHKDFENEKI